MPSGHHLEARRVGVSSSARTSLPRRLLILRRLPLLLTVGIDDEAFEVEPLFSQGCPNRVFLSDQPLADVGVLRVYDGGYGSMVHLDGDRDLPEIVRLQPH